MLHKSLGYRLRDNIDNNYNIDNSEHESDGYIVYLHRRQEEKSIQKEKIQQVKQVLINGSVSTFEKKDATNKAKNILHWPKNASGKSKITLFTPICP